MNPPTHPLEKDQYTGKSTFFILLAVLLFAGRLEIWHIYLMTATSSVFNAFQEPAYSAATTLLVPKQHLSRANGLIQIGRAAARLAAPALAGFLVDTFDFDAVYYSMAGVYLLSTICIFFLPRTRTETTKRSSALPDIPNSFKDIRRETTILLIIVFTLLGMICGMPFMQLLPIFTEDILKVGGTGLGILMSVSGIGAIAVSLVLASMTNKKRGIMMLFTGFILSLSLIAFSFNTSWFLALVLAVFIGLGQTGQTAFGFTLVQYYVDPAYRGRAMSFMMLGFGLAGLGAFFGGTLADSISIVWSIGGLAVALGVVCVWMLLFSSRLRNLD